MTVGELMVLLKRAPRGLQVAVQLDEPKKHNLIG